MTDEHRCGSCSDTSCSAQERRPGEKEAEYVERQLLTSRMCQIQRKLVVLSGKGGVGKSTVAVNLAWALAMAGKKVGLLDIDIHGPSVPKLLHIENVPVQGTDNVIYPVRVGPRLHVMSIGLLLRGRDDAVIWRGPMKHNVIKQFLKDVQWGELDYLVIDSPPGTGDEPLAVIQLIDNADGAIVVTTPQELAVQDVRRSIMFCRTLNLPVFGVLENMSGFVCPDCGHQVDIFGCGGGQAMAEEMEVPFLGAVPVDPVVVTSGDHGRPMVEAFPHSESARAFGRVIRKLLEPELAKDRKADVRTETKGKDGSVKIALPVAQGMLCMHFGHCEQFALFDVDPHEKVIQGKQMLDPPAHEPGVLPRWLHEQGADVIIAGGMGIRAQNLFNQNGIEVVVGAPAENPDEVVRAYLEGSLQTGPNVCDH